MKAEVENMKKQMNFLAGFLCGAMMFGGVTAAAVELVVKPSWQPIYVDGEQVSMTAYNINGNNYVKLRDIGREVGFNVYWDNGVRVDSTTDYTGEPPAEASPQRPESKPNPEQIRLDIVEQVNALRQERGRKPLAVNASLMAAAQECAEQQFRDHDNRIECETVLKHGYPYGFGSNLTTLSYSHGTDLAARAVSSWRNSPGHDETMMAEECDSIGVGVAVTENWVFCYLFAGCPTSNNPYA